MPLLSAGNSLIILGFCCIISALILVKNTGRNRFLSKKLLISSEIGLGQIQLGLGSYYLGISLIGFFQYIPGINGHKHRSGAYCITQLYISVQNPPPYLKRQISFISAPNGTGISTLNNPIIDTNFLCFNNNWFFLRLLIFATAGQNCHGYNYG